MVNLPILGNFTQLFSHLGKSPQSPANSDPRRPRAPNELLPRRKRPATTAASDRPGAGQQEPGRASLTELLGPTRTALPVRPGERTWAPGHQFTGRAAGFRPSDQASSAVGVANLCPAVSVTCRKALHRKGLRRPRAISRAAREHVDQGVGGGSGGRARATARML